MEEIEFDPHVEDDVLRLMFTACHPVLSVEARVAPTSKMVAGRLLPRRRGFTTKRKPTVLAARWTVSVPRTAKERACGTPSASRAAPDLLVPASADRVDPRAWGRSRRK